MTDKFIFRNNQIVGHYAAEDDELFLTDCFVDTGILGFLRDCSDQRCLLIGRTGSGKSALIKRINEAEEHVIRIQPDSLALKYVSDSVIIKFFSEAGVNMNLFYRLLWRHVFCVEILKEKFGIDSERKKQSFLTDIWNIITRNKKYELALDYLQKWGESFWKETDQRVKEVTQKLERDLQGAVESTAPGLKLNLSAVKKLSEEQKEEIINRGQQVVEQVQIRELSNIMDFIDEILLQDRKKRYYITIDKLDEDWVEDRLRFRLIRALIETAMEFTRIQNVKVIIALRHDLVDRVFRFTRDTGFQEEKYRTSMLNLSWTKDMLTQVLDARIDKLVRGQYTKQKVTHKDILGPIPANKKTRIATIDYMLSRTLLRPRDIIHFFNTCISVSDGKTIIEAKSLFEAEGIYSRDRFRALVDEWYGVYPNLGPMAQILKRRNQQFSVSDLSLEDIGNLCLETVVSPGAVDGIDLYEMTMVTEGNLRLEEYRKNLILIFYKVGLVGLKTNNTMAISWSYTVVPSISGAEIDDDTKVYIHPTFWRHFGIVDRQS